MNYNSDRILNLLFFPFLSLLFVSFANRNGICILIYTRNKSNERRDFLSPSDDIIYIYIYIYIVYHHLCTPFSSRRHAVGMELTNLIFSDALKILYFTVSVTFLWRISTVSYHRVQF